MKKQRLSLRTINNVAKDRNLQLVKGAGYFYWIGTSLPVAEGLMRLPTTAVYVYKINDLDFGGWLDEMNDVLLNVAIH